MEDKTLYTTYGYFLIAKNVYDIKSFINSNHQAFKVLFEISNTDSEGNFSISFEYDDNHRILIPFTIFGDTEEKKNKVYNYIFTQIREFFPSCEKLVKVNIKDDNDQVYFNNVIYDCLNDQRSFFNE